LLRSIASISRFSGFFFVLCILMSFCFPMSRFFALCLRVLCNLSPVLCSLSSIQRSTISFSLLCLPSSFLFHLCSIPYPSPLFPYPMSSGVPLLLTSVYLFLLFLLLLASLSVVVGFVCAGIPAFAGVLYCVGGPVVAFIPAVPCFSAVVSSYNDAVILNVCLGCWRYCCCLCHCYCWRPDSGRHPCCCWRSF
jgi:hypothetical protein